MKYVCGVHCKSSLYAHYLPLLTGSDSYFMHVVPSHLLGLMGEVKLCYGVIAYQHRATGITMLCHLPLISSDLLGLGLGRIPHAKISGRLSSHQILTQHSWHGAGDQVLRELPSPGKSGSVFFVSNDERYMIKTMRKVSQHHLRTCVETSRLRP